MARTNFKRPIWIPLCLIFACIICLVVTYIIIGKEAWWVVLDIAGMATLCLAGFVEALTAYMRLSPEGIEYCENFRSATIPKTDIENVTWEKGCGVSVFLKNGKWREVPSMNFNIQAVANSIRAWLKTSA